MGGSLGSFIESFWDGLGAELWSISVADVVACVGDGDGDQEDEDDDENDGHES